MLPIDPSEIDPSDYGEETATLRMDHEAAVEHVRESFQKAGFGIATEFSISGLLEEKIGADRTPHYVLGACNPEMADRALDATDEKLGALAPCNVVVWEAEPGVQRVYHLSIMRIARLLGLASDDDAMAEVVADTGELVAAAFENVRDVEAAAAD
jgi:uncharacterized protein (DUF302 family)